MTSQPNRTTFTQVAVDKLKPPEQGTITVWDRVLPGFGLRISATGRKSWIAMYRVDGKPVMETLGNTFTIPQLKDARDRARESINKAKSGVHPVEARRAAKAAREAEAATAVETARLEVEHRFENVANRYLTEGRRRDGTIGYDGEVRRVFEHDVIPRWRDKAIRAITKHDVNELLDAKSKSRERPRKGTSGGAGIQANRTLVPLRKFFRWAIDQELIDRDPSAGVGLRGTERARERVLSDQEIVWFWRATERAGWPFGPIFKLLLLTGQREGEVGGMRWSEFDVEQRLWTIPAERTKSRREHLVPLSETVIGIIDPLPRIGSLVFPSRADTVITSYSKSKDRIDAAMAAQWEEAGGDPERAIKSWVFHDLRRTATTIMARRNVPPHVADKVLNHSVGTGKISGVAAVYNRYDYLDERKAALDTLARFVMSLVRPTPTNIVPITAARS